MEIFTFIYQIESTC